MSYTGGTVVAMAGDGCVCIATDLRLGEQMTTVATNVKKIHKIGDRLYVGLCGFYSDALTVKNHVLYRKSLYELRENRKMRPEVSYSSSEIGIFSLLCLGCCNHDLEYAVQPSIRWILH